MFRLVAKSERTIPSSRRGGRDRGYVTVLVLTVAGLLAALVAATLHVARPSLGQAIVNADELQADGLLEAGVAAAGYALFASKKPPQSVSGAVLPFETGAVRITVRSEAGRVDLNGADVRLLEGLYAAFGGGGMTPQAFASRVFDWRDKNDKPRPGGAEAPEYTGSGLDYGPANKPFQSVGELNFVAGLTADDIALLRPYITVFNPGGLIDPAGADPAVLLAVPRMTGGQASAIVEAFANPETPAAERKKIIRPFRKYLTARSPNVFRITVEARLPTGFAKSVETVLMAGNNRTPYRILYWQTVATPVGDPEGAA